MRRAIVIGLAWMLAAGILQAEESFAARLAVALQQMGWTEEAAQLVIRQQAEWSVAEGADPQGVALALRYALQNRAFEPEEQAHLAVEVAAGLKAAVAEGLHTREAVRTVLRAMRQALSQTEDARGTGDLLRTRLREQIRLAACDETRLRLQEQDRDRLRDRTDGWVPGGPSTGARWGEPRGKS